MNVADQWRAMSADLNYRPDIAQQIGETFTRFVTAGPSATFAQQEALLFAVANLAEQVVMPLKQIVTDPTHPLYRALSVFDMSGWMARKEWIRLRARRKWDVIRTHHKKLATGGALFNPTGPVPTSNDNYWLEMADPKHRSWGHLDDNGVFNAWMQSDTMLSFFEWADQMGYGAHPSVDYVAADRRWRYRVHFRDGLLYDVDTDGTQRVFSTADHETNASGFGFAIWVCSRGGAFYTGSHKVSEFHHSSFLEGGRVMCAGEWGVTGGRIIYISRKTGHYRSRLEDLLPVLALLDATTDLSSTIYYDSPFDGGLDKYYRAQDVIAAKGRPANSLPADRIDYLEAMRAEIRNPQAPPSAQPRRRGGAVSEPRPAVPAPAALSLEHYGIKV